MDLTVTTATLASAAGEVARLLPGRATSPVLAGVLLTADAHGACRTAAAASNVPSSTTASNVRTWSSGNPGITAANDT